jgi:hypothetical protein
MSDRCQLDVIGDVFVKLAAGRHTAQVSALVNCPGSELELDEAME